MKKILMATDLSARCDRALQRALALADQFGAELHIMHVVEEYFSDVLTTEHETAARKAIEQQVRSLPHGGTLKVTPHITRGMDAENIIRHAEEHGADLVILGLHRYKTRQMFQGTTAERVVRYGRVPILVVKNSVAGPYQRALVAADLSSHARAAARMAARLVVPTGVVQLFHVAHRPFVGFLSRDTQDRRILEQQSEVRAILEGDIERLSNELGEEAPKFEVLLREGEVKDTIRENLASLKPDLLAVGTHGRTGLAHAIVGSVAEDLLANPTVDVLTIKDAVGR